MTIFLNFVDDSIIITMRAESDDGTIGDFRQTMQPGQIFAGYTYNELRTLGEGRHELPERKPSSGITN